MPTLPLPVIPVLDMLAGRVVRAVGGRRADYRPVVSRLAPDGASAGAIAANLLAASGSSELYVADLDAIQGGPVQVAMLTEIAATGAALRVDAGLRRPPLPVGFGGRWVIGTETWLEPAELPAGAAHIVSGLARRGVVGGEHLAKTRRPRRRGVFCRQQVPCRRGRRAFPRQPRRCGSLRPRLC